MARSRSSTRWVAALLLALLASGTAGRAAAQAAGPPPAGWVVSGLQIAPKRRGPVFWRVSRGAAEVWVLAAPDSLTVGDWDTTQVKAILAQTRVVYTPPRVSIGVFGALGVIFGGQYKEPGGRTLADVLTPAELARFTSVAKAARLKPGDWMRLRPAWAAALLLPAALNARHAAPPEARVGALARQAHVPVRSVATFKAAALLKELSAIPARQAAPCLNAAVDDVAFQTANLDEASRAWSTGNLAALQRHYRADEGIGCVARLGGLGQAVSLSVNDTVQAVQGALAQGGGALFVLNMNAFLRPGGVGESLKRQGYEVDAPAE